MIRKLHAFVLGQCCEESNDNLMFQEVLLPSTLYMQVLRVSTIQTRKYMVVYATYLLVAQAWPLKSGERQLNRLSLGYNNGKFLCFSRRRFAKL